MDSKYILIVLIIVLLTSSVVLGASNNYYGKTYIYFDIPVVISFNVTLPNNVVYESSDAIGSTADEEFNSTSDDKNMTVYVVGTEYRQNSTVIGDANNVTNYKVNNTGNININITLCMNESLPVSIVLFGTKTADPYDNPQTITNCSEGSWIANSSLEPGVIDEIWIWTNFTNAQGPDSTARILYINSTESGT